MIIGISALTVGSQVVSVVPTNVLAADKSKTTVAAKATTTQTQTQSAKAVKAGTIVDVANYADFKAALANNEVSTINLTGDIEFPPAVSYTDAVLTHSVVVNGNDHTINQHRSTINGLRNGANTITFNDVNVVADKYDGDFAWYGLVYSNVEGFTINLNNVTYNGPQAIFNTNGTVNISGNTTLTSTGNQENIESRNVNFKKDAASTLTTTSNVGIRTTGKGSVVLEDGANVVFNNTSHSIYTSNDESKVLVAPKAVAKFTNKTTSIYMAGTKNNITIQGEADFKTDAYYGMQLNGSSNVLDVQDNAKVDLNTYQTSVYMPGTLNQVNIGANATFTAKNRELYGLHLAGENSILNIKDNANVNLQTGHSGIIMAGKGEKLNIGKAAKVDITNKAEQSIIMDGVGSVLDIKDNAEINLTSGYHSIFMPQLNSKVNVGAAVKFKAESQFGAYMPYADLNIADKAEINFKATNNAVNFPQLYVKNTTVGTDATFNVKSSPVSGHAFYSEGNSNIAFNNQTVGVWKNANTTNTPTYSWDDLTGTATLNQYNSTNSMSANDNFRAVFQMNDYNRIAGKNISAPELIVNEVGDNDEAIKGTTTPGSTIKAVYGGKTVEGTVNADGSYSIPTGKIPAGTEVVVTATAGNKDTSKTVTVVDKTAPEAPNVDPVKETDTVVKGSGEKGATVTVHLPNGTTKTGTVGEDGQFSVAIPAQEAGKQISVTLTDNANKTSESTTVTVAANEGTITPNDYHIGEAFIKGSFTGDVQIAKLYIDGEYVSSGGSFDKATGQFTYYVGSKVKDGDTVTLVAFDSKGRQLDSKNVNVIYENNSLTLDDFYADGQFITGSFTGKIDFANLLVNGQQTNIWGGLFNKTDGTFQFYIKAGTIKAGDKVTVRGYQKGNNTILDEKTITAKGLKAHITPSDYTLGERNIAGTFTGDINFAQLLVNDKAVNWGGTFDSATGKFSYYVPEGSIKKGDVVKLRGYHKNSTNQLELLDEVVVNVKEVVNNKLTPEPYQLDSATIKGTYEGDIDFASLFVNGERKNWGGEFNKATGEFTYYVPKGAIKAGDVVTLYGYKKDNLALLVQQNVTIATSK